MYKEIRKILSNSCLSADNNGCEYDGNCYEHENAKIEELISENDSDLLDKVAHELKETFNTECPINYTSTQPFFTLENVRTLVDMVIKDMKAEVEE